MTQFTYMAIKVADEDQFNQVAEKLRGMGYKADKDPYFGTWKRKFASENFHVFAYTTGEYGIYGHKGGASTRYTFEQFMQL
jgi:hypothetical protein